MFYLTGSGVLFNLIGNKSNYCVKMANCQCT